MIDMDEHVRMVLSRQADLMVVPDLQPADGMVRVGDPRGSPTRRVWIGVAAAVVAALAVGATLAISAGRNITAVPSASGLGSSPTTTPATSPVVDGVATYGSMTLADRSVVAVGVTDAGDQACLLTDWAPKVCDPLPTPVSPVTIPFAHVFESTLGQPQRHVIWGVIQSGFTAVLVSNGVQTPVVRSPRSGNGLSGFAQTVSAAGPGAHLEIRDSNGTVVQTTALAATPTTSAASPTTAGAGPGAPVAIGDLVMLGARSRLEALGIKVDASANRRPQDFVAELDALRSANAIGDTVVIQVGLNGAITNDELDQIVAAIPQSQTPNLVFMTVQAPAAWIEGNNERIKALPSRYPWVKILDWATLSANVALCPDGIHLSCNGPAPAEYYANAVLNAIRSAGRPQPSS